MLCTMRGQGIVKRLGTAFGLWMASGHTAVAEKEAIEMSVLQVGNVTFREIRENDYCYVDKTAFIEEFFSSAIKSSLFTRPRRFGKTLMMNMLKDFFDITQDSKALFEGLVISKNKPLCDKWMNQYPTVLLSLKEMEGDNFYEAMVEFSHIIERMCGDLSYLQESHLVGQQEKDTLAILGKVSKEKDVLTNSLVTLCRALYAHWDRPLILLIDEYDVPLARAQENGYYPEMVKFIRKLLGSVLKDSSILKFAILTGCLRISKESSYTGLNNLRCYDFSNVRFADKFGFTSKEVDDLLAASGCSAKKDEIREWYDGYRFGVDTEIYCPWDILQYIEDLQANPAAKPKAYWQNTSGNDIVRTFVDYCNVRDIRRKLDTLMTGSCIATRIIEYLTYDRLYDDAENMWSVLYLTGYLTKASQEQIKKCGMKPEPDQTVLAIPNKEVLEIFADVISKWFKKEVQNIDRSELFKAFWADDADALAKLLCDQMDDTLSYYDAREDFYHAFVLGLFTFTGWDVESNKEYGDGRPDIVVSDTKNKRAAIIEIKRGRSQRGLPGLAAKGIRQIRKNRYAAPLLKKEDWTVSLWGMAFFKKTCVVKVEEVVTHP